MVRINGSSLARPKPSRREEEIRKRLESPHRVRKAAGTKPAAKPKAKAAAVKPVKGTRRKPARAFGWDPPASAARLPPLKSVTRLLKNGEKGGAKQPAAKDKPAAQQKTTAAAVQGRAGPPTPAVTPARPGKTDLRRPGSRGYLPKDYFYPRPGRPMGGEEPSPEGVPVARGGVGQREDPTQTWERGPIPMDEGPPTTAEGYLPKEGEPAYFPQRPGRPEGGEGPPVVSPPETGGVDPVTGVPEFLRKPGATGAVDPVTGVPELLKKPEAALPHSEDELEGMRQKHLNAEEAGESPLGTYHAWQRAVRENASAKAKAEAPPVAGRPDLERRQPGQREGETADQFKQRQEDIRDARMQGRRYHEVKEERESRGRAETALATSREHQIAMAKKAAGPGHAKDTIAAMGQALTIQKETFAKLQAALKASSGANRETLQQTYTALLRSAEKANERLVQQYNAVHRQYVALQKEISSVTAKQGGLKGTVAKESAANLDKFTKAMTALQGEEEIEKQTIMLSQVREQWPELFNNMQLKVEGDKLIEGIRDGNPDLADRMDEITSITNKLTFADDDVTKRVLRKLLKREASEFAGLDHGEHSEAANKFIGYLKYYRPVDELTGDSDPELTEDQPDQKGFWASLGSQVAGVVSGAGAAARGAKYLAPTPEARESLQRRAVTPGGAAPRPAATPRPTPGGAGLKRPGSAAPQGPTDVTKDLPEAYPETQSGPPVATAPRTATAPPPAAPKHGEQRTFRGRTFKYDENTQRWVG